MRTYTIKQAAEVLQITEATARELAKQGQLPGSKIGRQWRFTEEDLKTFLDNNRYKRSQETSP